MRLVWGAPGADLCERDDSWVQVWSGGYFCVCGGKYIFYGVKFECLAGSLSLSRFKDN